MTSTRTNSTSTAIAIVVAGVLIAVALFFSGKSAENLPRTAGGHGNTAVAAGDFRLPSDDDHSLGNPNASVTIVEFSDFECPFCARLHPTLARILEENEDIRWVYRHFPLSEIHGSALSSAVASECVAKLGGNDAFWSFADSAFQNQSRLGNAFYREQASALGIDLDAFNSCLSDRSVTQDVSEDRDEAIASGGQGTPFSVVISASGHRTPFSGALPYEQVAALVEQARSR
ncbi:MAG: thioredoxin domain-containing protein [Patescibacteria group bacterium]